MDIEERAEKWAREYCHERYGVSEPTGMDQNDLIRAYLAGSAQAAADYTKHYEEEKRRNNER